MVEVNRFLLIYVLLNPHTHTHTLDITHTHTHTHTHTRTGKLVCWGSDEFQQISGETLTPKPETRILSICAAAAERTSIWRVGTKP